jgi:hypothetical protein
MNRIVSSFTTTTASTQTVSMGQCGDESDDPQDAGAITASERVLRTTDWHDSARMPGLADSVARGSPILEQWVGHYHRGRPYASLGPGIPDAPDLAPMLSGHRIRDGHEVVAKSIRRPSSRIPSRTTGSVSELA